LSLATLLTTLARGLRLLARFLLLSTLLLAALAGGLRLLTAALVRIVLVH
jgi:hypothetical protein